MFIYKSVSSQADSERKVNKIKLQATVKSSIKKNDQVKASKKSSGKSHLKKVTQVNKKFLEQLGLTLQK